MRKNILSVLKDWYWVTVCAVFTFFLFSSLFTGSAHIANAQKAGPAIEYHVAPSAKITKVSYYFENFREQNTIVFEVAVKNISSTPKRFRVKVFIDDGPSAAYFYPLAGNPPVLKPGETHIQPLPMVFFDKLPLGFTIRVEEVAV
jgi:hypothetical protein